MKRLTFPGIVFLVLVGFCIWYFSPTQTLKRKTNSLLSTLTLDAGAGKVARQTGAYSLNRLLAAQVVLKTPTIKEANGTFDRDELESAYSWLCNQAKESRFESQKFHSVDIDGEKAIVKLTLEGMVELPNYRPADGIYDVTFEWQKEEDGWRIYRAEWTQNP